MTEDYRLDGAEFAKLVQAGAENLKEHAKEVNDLNVFPVPDGDTGDNMVLTIKGGAGAARNDTGIAGASKSIADGMLLSARGNSGVILSQFFAGIAQGLDGIEKAGPAELCAALRRGVEKAYGAVVAPSEGTILTVIRMATEYVEKNSFSTVEDTLRAFVEEGYRVLEKTPEFLPVLKTAGVVDSGGAGLLYIMEGMLRALTGEEIIRSYGEESVKEGVDLDCFTAESVLEYGYCTECLLRLQTAKTDIGEFDVAVITDYLSSIGDSVVAVANGSIVKLHVHTKTPGRVFDFCQRYGEFLTVKVENMSLQHNGTAGAAQQEKTERKKYGIVAVCAGEGIKELFIDAGADVIVDGGQSMNPSAEDFIKAYERVNADTVYVFPNNSNIFLAARQAAGMFSGSDIRVLESRTVGEGYAAISMFDPSAGSPDAIEEDLRAAMEGVLTAEVSLCVRDVTDMDVRKGEYIGFVGKEVIASHKEREECAVNTAKALDTENGDIIIVARGKDAPEDEAEKVLSRLEDVYPDKEVYLIDGRQAIYDYIFIVR